MGLSCAYYRTSRLLNEMAQASSTGSLNKWLAKIKKTDILILDDWGLSTVNPLESLFLYEAFEERCGERSTILTAQVPVSKWHDLFEDPTKADAVLDRITHNAYRITLQGHSLRADTANLMSKEPSENEPMATEEGDGVV
jgi:DNA replication protein DnaC